MSRAARVRTESMAQRLAKQPISEGFMLMDKGYVLGAMRLFIFKAETSPPYQLGACLDAMGHLLARLEEGEDAKENFGYAAEKYELILQPVLASLMKIKGQEATEGKGAALAAITALLQEKDPKREAASLTDAKLKAALARCYHFRSELLLETSETPDAAALADAELAASIGWDRGHLAWFTVAQARQASGNDAGAIEAYEKCIAVNPHFVLAYEEAIPLLAATGAGERALALFPKAIEQHPKSSLIRGYAFALSSAGNDTEALALLDKYIKDPPHEETESLVAEAGGTTSLFLKAKAAIYADSGKMPEALAAATEALAHAPNDEEAKQLIADIKAGSN